jgi:hypothetical protein
MLPPPSLVSWDWGSGFIDTETWIEIVHRSLGK